MARTVSLNKRFNRGVPARAYIKHLHVYTEGEITEKEYLNAFCREIIPVHPEFRLSIKPSKGKSSPRKILDAMRRDAKLFGDKRSNEIWVLIDQDDWPASHVEELKEGKGIRQAVSIYKVLQSIPKFELWVLLHFEKANGISTSKEIDEKLKTIIQNYNKHLPDNLFTWSNVQEAVSNAKLRVRNGHAAQTQVYELIEHLLELAPTMTDTTP